MLVSLSLGCMMLLSSSLAVVMTPTIRLAEQRPKIKLEQVVPRQFGDWTEEDVVTASIINPRQESILGKIYAETISRAYVNSAGERVMLSIAYGPDQRKGNEVHYPEICYPAQGFELTSLRRDVLNTSSGVIPVNRLETNLSRQRFEPVTYWTTIGNEVTLGGTDRRLKEMTYGFRGEIADGLVFRVSTIDRDPAHAYSVQDSFVGALVGVLNPANKIWLTGLR
jgi:EpsI family protein